jgi:hypothetical protein
VLSFSMGFFANVQWFPLYIEICMLNSNTRKFLHRFVPRNSKVFIQKLLSSFVNPKDSVIFVKGFKQVRFMKKRLPQAKVINLSAARLEPTIRCNFHLHRPTLTCALNNCLSLSLRRMKDSPRVTSRDFLEEPWDSLNVTCNECQQPMGRMEYYKCNIMCVEER